MHFRVMGGDHGKPTQTALTGTWVNQSAQWPSPIRLGGGSCNSHCCFGRHDATHGVMQTRPNQNVLCSTRSVAFAGDGHIGAHYRAALKGTNLRGQTPLRFPAKYICNFQQKCQFPNRFSLTSSWTGDNLQNVNQTFCLVMQVDKSYNEYVCTCEGMSYILQHQHHQITHVCVKTQRPGPFQRFDVGDPVPHWVRGGASLRSATVLPNRTAWGWKSPKQGGEATVFRKMPSFRWHQECPTFWHGLGTFKHQVSTWWKNSQAHMITNTCTNRIPKIKSKYSSKPRANSRKDLDTDNLSAPNHKSQIASDLKSRSPNRKNFPQIAVSGSSNHTFKSRDLWFEPLFKSPLESQCQFLIRVVRTMSFSEKIHIVSNR